METRNFARTRTTTQCCRETFRRPQHIQRTPLRLRYQCEIGYATESPRLNREAALKRPNVLFEKLFGGWGRRDVKEINRRIGRTNAKRKF